MKNFKILRKVMLLALVLTMVVGAFAVNGSAAETTAVSPAKNLLDGVTFDDFSGDLTDRAVVADYIYKSSGMLITSTNSTTHHSKVTLSGNADDGYAIAVEELRQPLYVDAKGSGGAYDANEHAKNKDILDLLYSTTGPKSFSISLDMTIQDNDDKEGNVGNVSRTGDKSTFDTYYRGPSVFTFVGTAWVMKATSANLPKYTIDADGYAVIDPNGVAENMKDKGYLYPAKIGGKSTTATFKAKADDTSGNKYWSLSSGANYTDNGATGNAMSPEYMASADAFTYSIGVPFNVELRFTRNTGDNKDKMTVQAYVGGKKFGDPISYNLNNTANNDGIKYGWRWFDQSPICDIDNIKVTVTGCAEAHDGTANTHTGVWSTVDTVITNTPDSFHIKKVCLDSGIAYEKYFVTDVIANEIKDVVVDKYTTGTLTITDPKGIVNGTDTKDIVNGASDYWIAADINTGAGFVAPASDATLVTVGGSPVLKLNTAGKPALADGTAIGDALAAKNSYALALNMIPTATEGKYDCAVYIDGELVGTAKDIAVADATLKLDAYNALRILNIKAVKLGTTGTAVAVKSVAETEAMPCSGHLERPGTYTWYHNVINAAKGINDLTFSYVCDKCGERIYEKQGASLYSATDSANTLFDGDGVFQIGSAHHTNSIARDTSVALTDGYWIFFDVDVLALNADTIAAKKTGGGTFFKLNESGNAMMRLYSIADTDGNPTTLDYELSELVTNGTHFGVETGYNTNAFLVRDKTTGKNIAIFENGKSYRVAIHSKYSSTNVADVYINGELVGTNYRSVSSWTTETNKYPVRFKDGPYGAFNISNFAYVNAADAAYAPHVHTDKWSDGYTIINGYNTLDLAYTCYCGEVVPKWEISECVAKLDSVYFGKAEIKDLPTIGDYWFTTNYYIANADALAKADNIITLGNYSVLDTAKLAPEAGKTYEIAVNVAYSAENSAEINVYVDNKLVRTVQNIDSSELGSTVVLGDGVGTDVRFRYAKAVKLGYSTSRIFAEFNEVAEAIKPCYHDGVTDFVVTKGESYGTDKRVQGVRGLVKKYECTKCGETIYEKQGDVLGIDQTTVKDSTERYMQLDASGSYIGNNIDGAGDTFSSHSYIVTDYESVSTAADPYWLSFDYKFEANSTQMTAVENKTKNGGGGASFVALRVANAHYFLQWMRGYAVDKPEGGYYEDRYAIKLGGGNSPLTGIADWANVVLMAGQTYNVSIYVEPGTEGYYYTLYVDGKNVGTNGGKPNAAYSATDEIFMFRFLDGGYGDFSIANFALTKAVEHVHTDEWSDHYIESGYNILNEYYDCYCGETVKCGSLTDIVKPNLNNVYYGVGTVEGLPTTGNYWFTTNYYIANDDAIAEAGNIISLGDYMVFSVDEIAALTSKTTYRIAMKTVYTAEKVADIYVYVDDKLVKSVLGADLSAAGDLGVITLGGGERNTDIRFGYPKAVKVGTEAPVNTKVTFVDAVDGEIRPCYHSPKQGTYKWYQNLINATTGVYDLMYSYTCDKCGEFVYIEQGANLYASTNTNFKDDGAWNISSSHNTSNIARDTSVSLTDGYWLVFDLEVVDVNADNLAAKNAASGIGEGNFLNVFGTFESVLRLYTIADTDGDTTTLDYTLEDIDQNLPTVEYSIPTGGSYNTEAVLLAVKTNKTFTVNGTSGIAGFNSKLAIIENGKTYRIAIYSPYSATNDTKTEVYVDGVLMATNARALGTLQENAFRIKDGLYGNFNISNFSFVNAVELPHVHSDKWATAEERSMVMTDTSLEYYYTCYCGSKVKGGSIAASVEGAEALPQVYNGAHTIEIAADKLSAGTWFATDINVREAITDRSLVNIGGNEVVALKDGKLVVGGKATDISVTYPNTYSIATRIVSATSYEIYVDGVYNGTYAVEAFGDNIVLGAEATEALRFNYNRLVVLSADGTFIPTYAIDEEVEPCYHVDATPIEDKVVTLGADGVAKYTMICSVCGERVYGALVDSLVDTSLLTGNKCITASELKNGFTTSGDRYLYLPKGVIGSTASPYWLIFKVTPTSFPTTTGRDLKSNSTELEPPTNQRSYKGWGLITVQSTSGIYSSELRVMADGWEEGVATVGDDDYLVKGKEDGKLQVHIYSKDIPVRETEPVAYLEKGVTTTFALYINPKTGAYDVYVDGVYKTTSTGKGGNVDGAAPAIRVNEGGTYKFENLQVVSPQVGAHVHMDNWLSKDELAAARLYMLADNKVGYEYKCYCGATVTAGIEEVLKDAITPKYSVTEETVVLPVSEFDMSAVEKDFWLLASVKVNKYPESATPRALISIGDTDLVSIDNGGNIAVGGVKTDAVLTNYTYMPFAIKFDVSMSTYYVYYERTCIGKGTIDDLAADINVAGGNLGNYHFDRMALVVLGADGNLSFVGGDDGHAHTALPENTTLVLGADKTTVQLTYTCSICERKITEGIKTNLYDDPADDVVSTIPPVYGVATEIATISELINSETPVWISMYATLTDASAYKGDYPFAALVPVDGKNVDILVLGADGIVRDSSGLSVGMLGAAAANITMSVVEVDGKYSINYYFNGKYCATRTVAIDAAQTYELVLGNGSVATLSLTDIKLAELALDSNYAIGAYVCEDGHTFVVNSKTTIDYFDVNSFAVHYNCAKCGMACVDEAVASYYDSTPHIYEAMGEVGKTANTEIDASAYWISVDVNVRAANIGKFDGYVPLVSYNGTAYLLINSKGNLMLGDGTKLSARFPMGDITTYNVALRYETESGKLYAFIDGKYVGCSTGTVNAEGTVLTNDREVFGAPELENIRYYNIKSLVSGEASEKVAFKFVEDLSYVPCAHLNTSKYVGIVLTPDKPITQIYICNTCGERYTVYRADNLLTSASGVTNGTFTATTAKYITSSEDILSVENKLGNEAYWVRFTVDVQKIIDGEALIAQKGADVKTGGVTFFGLARDNNYVHLLRLFPVSDGGGGYHTDRADIRSSNSYKAKLLVTIYEGETYDFAISVNPTSGIVAVYIDGVLISEHKAGKLAADGEKYGFRFLDGGWGTYKVTNFELTTGAKHEHTSKYVPYMDGAYDFIAYGDTTLTHRYTCYCGAEVVEGIEDIYLDAIPDMSVSTTSTAISSSDIMMNYKPYWLSAKVHYGNDAATVYSIGDTSLVETDGSVYKIGGVETEVAVSANDYDVVSMRVEPKNGDYYVYVNGAFIGSGNYDFGIDSKFGILLGGGSALEFTNIKLVSLAEGAEGTVMICGDHAYTSGILAMKSVTLDSARKIATLVCECKICHEEFTCNISDTTDITATPSNDKGVAKDDYVFGADGSFNIGDGVYVENAQTFVYYTFDKASVVDDKTPYWFSFDVKFNDIPYIKEGDNDPVAAPESLYNNNAGLNLMNFDGKYESPVRVFPVSNGEGGFYADRVELKSGRKEAAQHLITLTKGDSANITMRVDISGKTPVLDIFINGVLTVTRTDSFIDVTKNMIRLGDYCGSFTLSNMNVYRADIADPVVDGAGVSLPKLHMPTKTNPGTITYGEDGSLKHEFKCSTCTDNVTHTFDYANELQDASLNKGKLYTEVLGVTSIRTVKIPESVVSNAGTPYWFFVDITPDSVNTSGIQDKGSGGASILSLRMAYDADGNGSISETEYDYIHLLRAYYRNNKVVLDCSLDSGSTLERELVVGETLRYAFVIDPTSGTILIYVDGVLCGKGTKSFATGGEEYAIRFLDQNWGAYNFTNIKFVQMTDQCVHDQSCVDCVDGATCECADCGKTVAAVHNYVATVDETKMWTKYTCQDCGKYYIEFNDKSLLVDEDDNELVFATNAKLIEYLTKTYMPIFPAKEIVE